MRCNLETAEPSVLRPRTRVKLEAAFSKMWAQVPIAFVKRLVQSIYWQCMISFNTLGWHKPYWKYDAQQMRCARLAQYQNTWQRPIDCSQSAFKKLALSDWSKFISAILRLKHITESHTFRVSFAVQCLYSTKRYPISILSQSTSAFPGGSILPCKRPCIKVELINESNIWLEKWLKLAKTVVMGK